MDLVVGGAVSSDVNSGISERVQRALAEARKRCLKMANVACEQALRKYYALRAKQIEQDDAPVQEQLLRIGTELLGELGSRVLDYNGLGVLVGMPGIEPVYMGAALDRSADTGTVLDMSLPY
ncbi:unnamed protein product [Gongylonema pulchrum]|uniref:Uncharacterized protein n=1 Tax=Gongylonema pulchrum TaxID=637853 RepID=A0A3P7RJJ2_9BILA|nr:unnamed protein product [Gongylonema pulchrum]